MSETVFVAVELDGQTVDAGTAYFIRRHNVLSTSFRYDDQYLSRAGAYAIDPVLPLAAGNHAPDRLPGAFADCSPDRWGKNLIAKKVRAEALRADRTPPSVSDIDYLMGVSDLTRQGALRFRTETDGQFLAADLTVPQVIELPSLLHAADSVARDADDMAAIKVLLDAGSGSAGGNRVVADTSSLGRRRAGARNRMHSDGRCSHQPTRQRESARLGALAQVDPRVVR